MLYAWVRKDGFEYENERIKNAMLNPIVGTRVKIEISVSKKARSLGWNAYYWKVTIPNGVAAAKGNGWEFNNDEMHEQFKKAFLPANYKTNKKTGERKKLEPTTTGMNNAEFEAFCIKCNQFTYEQSGVYVPLPEELKNGINKNIA